MKKSTELEIESKNREIASLSNDYEGLDEAYRDEKDPERKVSFKERRDSKMLQIRLLEEELRGLTSSRQGAYGSAQFKRDLPRIDFKEVTKDVQRILDLFEDGQRGDVLFLLQNSIQMEGELFIQILEDLLKNLTGDFKSYRIGTYAGSSPGFESFVEELSRQLPSKTDNDRLSVEQNNVQVIANSVKNGSVVFLEIHGWDCLENPFQEAALDQFIQNFWLPLVDYLNDRKKYRRVKFVAVLVADGEFKCDHSYFNRWKAMNDSFFCERLSLRTWRKDEIQVWLEDYPQCNEQDSLLLATKIFSGSTVRFSDGREAVEGIPNLVRSGLEKALLLN
ncbi:MAG: hypothetical protein HC860_15160 [Alkalinema sp. RU_4_3]|nr:hypothetical protein [Alkalinema sp. RU_4_3]